jgi:flavin-dependent thymidylate synthase
MKIVPHSVSLLHATPNAEQVIERAGRLCWKSEDRITDTSHTGFIRMLMEPGRKHESVLEHATAGFIVITDRGITHELVRHRIASYSQSSQPKVRRSNPGERHASKQSDATWRCWKLARNHRSLARCSPPV